MPDEIENFMTTIPSAVALKQRIDEIKKEAAKLRSDAAWKMRRVPALRNLLRVSELAAKAAGPAKRRTRKKKEAATPPLPGME